MKKIVWHFFNARYQEMELFKTLSQLYLDIRVTFAYHSEREQKPGSIKPRLFFGPKIQRQGFSQGQAGPTVISIRRTGLGKRGNTPQCSSQMEAKKYLFYAGSLSIKNCRMLARESPRKGSLGSAE